MSLPTTSSSLSLPLQGFSAAPPTLLSADLVGIDVLLVCDAQGRYRPAGAEDVLRHARQVLAQQLRRGQEMTSPAMVRDFLRVEIGALEHEVFCVLFMDTHHRLLAFREMFRGTIAQTSVYPREVVKEALALNAATCVLAHNHPSGSPEPSQADEALTRTLTAALSLVDVRVLDHLVVTRQAIVSFAERGLL